MKRSSWIYYKTSRCSYPISTNKILFESFGALAGCDSFQYIDTVSPRALLFIVGGEADTKYFSEEGFAKAIDLYDKPEYVDQVVKKLVEFYDKYIKN